MQWPKAARTQVSHSRIRDAEIQGRWKVTDGLKMDKSFSDDGPGFHVRSRNQEGLSGAIRERGICDPAQMRGEGGPRESVKRALERSLY